MNYQLFCELIFKLYSYKTMCKIIHYTTETNDEHRLIDEIYYDLGRTTDDIAEQFFAFYGKPKTNQLNLQNDINKEIDIVTLAQKTIDIFELMRKEFLKNEKLSGIVSTIDSYKSNISKVCFKASFDKISKIKLKH